jgi:hypothetical protein
MQPGSSLKRSCCHDRFKLEPYIFKIHGELFIKIAIAMNFLFAAGDCYVRIKNPKKLYPDLTVF